MAYMRGGGRSESNQSGRVRWACYPEDGTVVAFIGWFDRYPDTLRLVNMFSIPRVGHICDYCQKITE